MRTVALVSFFAMLLFRSEFLFATDDIPTAAFTNTTVCQGLPTVFTNNSSTLTGSIVASIWDFGDGQGSSVFSPQHVYASSGTFNVTLTVINSQGDVDDVSALITVHPSGTLNFSISAPNNCESSTFTLTNLSNVVSGNFMSYTWDFGDATGAGTQNTSHQYASYGTYTITLTTLTNNSCEKTFTKSLEVFPEANVDFQAQNVCQGTAMQFNNVTQVAAGLVSYQWNFGDGNNSAEINPQHMYASAGSPTVSLVATTEKGCVTNTSKQVTTHPMPMVSFTASDHCFGVNATFDNTSTISGGTMSHEWKFGDGTSVTTEDAQHTYATNGNYPVELIVISNHTCRATVTKFVRVTPKPIVNFSGTDICLGKSASFLNSSTIAEGEIAYEWNFGDGTTSAAVNPNHEYLTDGTFDVSLRASTASGSCPETIVKQITVSAQPQALFSVKDNCIDSTLVFRNTSVFTGTNISYQWQFGDGQIFTGFETSHDYASAQTYSVTLTATALSGCSDVETKAVKVFPQPQINFIANNECFGNAIAFQNFSNIASGSVSYEWSFGDQLKSTELEPQHDYTTHGSFQVLLKALSDHGCSNSKEKTVLVFPLPVTDFSAPPVCDGQIAKFTNQSTIAAGSIQNSQWDFGDETTSVIKSPSKEFLKDGVYTVRLISYSDRGCESQMEKTITVYPPPLANFSVSDVCARETISVQNTSAISSGSMTYYWDFGDLSNSIATSPTHDYQQFGVYTISLTATSDKGCADVVTRPVAIFSSPEINAGNDVTVSQGYPAQLQASGASEYRWEPIEGLNNSNISDPVATPLETTEYIVFGKNSFGCESSDTVRVIVSEEFKLVASNVLTPDDNGSNDAWVIDNVETFGDVNVRVYDRTGRLVFKQQAYQNDWRGTSGKDLLPDGTYYYYITFGSSDKVYKGALTIIRNNK
jgi:gliding motility-associated-like protein